MSVNFFEHRLQYKNEIENELRLDLKKIKVVDCYISDIEIQQKLDKLLTWLSNAPKTTVFRVNTLMCEQQVAYSHIKDVLNQYSRPLEILIFSHLKELIIVNSQDCLSELDLSKYPHEVIVDALCGAAVLRGSHIYAPGVLGMPRGLAAGDKVSVYADLKQACKKGLVKPYDEENKIFIGNGVVILTREHIFNQNTKKPNGIAVSMTDVISGVPQINESILPTGKVLLQNLPSILCSRILDPQPGEIVLDMCAAPGNKTTHISALMKNEGTVIALEKIKSKVERLNLSMDTFNVKNVEVFCFDSTKAVCETNNKSVKEGPPFSEESFDKILLDGPCSALGQRPQISNSISLSQLRSYIPLQRKLFSVAVQLLKSGGTLVYSTCTITVAENEGIVAWALKTFPNLYLQSVNNKLVNLKMEQFANVGYTIDGLSVEQSNQLCRFGYENDSVGFFIACFVKR